MWEQFCDNVLFAELEKPGLITAVNYGILSRCHDMNIVILLADG